jgi:hypothetical protein
MTLKKHCKLPDQWVQNARFSPSDCSKSVIMEIQLVR